MIEIKKEEQDVLLDIIDFVDPSITKDEYDAVKIMYNSIYSNNINSANIASQIVILMKIASTLEKVKNADKKKLVIFVIKKVVELNIKDENEIHVLNLFIDNILPNVIDTMCSIDSKNIIINESEKIIKTCCLPFF
jgi:hypothetical protein